MIVTGPVGVGKTTVAQEMGLLLRDANVPHANVDFDQLTACHPRPAADDRRAVELAALMDAERVEDVLVETDGRDPTSIAQHILLRVGWLTA